MTVRGIEAIHYYIPPASTVLNIDTQEEFAVQPEGGVVQGTAITMTSVERYSQEWTHLLETLESAPAKIREAASHGRLRVSKFRSVYWALLLRVLTEDHRNWRTERALQRARYEKFSADFVRNPHDGSATNNIDDDPLSQSTESIWNQYFNDQELLAVIKQDVVRTFPGVDFFRKPLVQQSMTNILFYFAREHPYMGYRQGMHEVLAPIIFVLYGDHQSLLHFKEIAKTEADATLLDVIDPRFLDADSFSLFSRLMSSVECYYRIRNIKQPDTYGANGAQIIASSHHTEAEVIGQLDRVRDKILAKEDLHLHNHLLKLDIPLHVFGIRWLRLLFGREFPLLDLLLLWDAIFANSDRFDLPNYIAAAMLVHIREKLLLSDYASALGHLMRYPNTSDINTIIGHALHMMEPKKYRRPDNVFTYVSISQQKDAVLQHQGRARSNSLQYQQTRKPSKQNTRATSSNDYTENLLLELDNAKRIIRSSRQQLLKYVAALHAQAAKYRSPEFERTLVGIEEICQLLDYKAAIDGISTSAPIDQATEADEQPVEPRRPSNIHLAARHFEQPDHDVLSTNLVRLLASKREIELQEIPASTRTSPN